MKLLFLLLFIPGIAFADAWVWFDLCKHETGQRQGAFILNGIATQGRTFRDTTDIVGIIPLEHDRCVLLDFGQHKISVKGSLDEVWCKVRTGPKCVEK